MQLTQQPPVNSFATMLGRLRRGADISQRALARRCGLTPAYLSLLEAGRRMPERPAVERIAAALELGDADRAALLLAAGYAPAGPAATAGPLADVEAVLRDASLGDEQRALIATLTKAYVEGLVARLRSGRPLVSNLAAPWQSRILEALQEKMAEDFESFRDAHLYPRFDL